MKKLFAAVSILLAAAVVGLIVLQTALTAQADDVFIERERIEGDPTAANGLEVSLRATMGDNLFWNVSQTFGLRPQVHTDFTYTEQRRSQSVSEGWLEIFCTTGVGISSSGNIDLEDQSNGYMLRPAIALAKETPAGEKRTGIYDMADFYDYYVLRSDIRIPSPSNNVRNALSSEEETSFLNEYFRFPILEGHQVEVNVEKDAQGNIRDVNMSPSSEVDFHFGTFEAYTDHGFYFTFSIYNGLTPIDTSHIRDGYGIYRIPLAENSAGVMHVPEDRDPIELAAALPTDIDVTNLAVNADEAELYLLWSREGTQYLTVYALPTMEEKQTIELPRIPYEGGVVHMTEILLNETGILLNGGTSMTLLAPDVPGGPLVIQCHGNYADADNELHGFYSWSGLQFAWNGELLALVQATDIYENCDFHLVVYDETGPLYHARCRLNLNDLVERGSVDYRDRVRYDAYNSYDNTNYLSVAWKSE